MKNCTLRWWPEDGSKCEKFTDTSTGGRKELTFHNVAGVFLVLGVGTAFAIGAALVEFIVVRRKKLSKVCSHFKSFLICFSM